MSVNRHGLSRDIPEDVRRTVRQRDGFGCVICGNAIIDYEHIDPEFNDATIHDPNGIILLCIQCHGMKTRGRLSRSTIEAARANPKAKATNFSYGPFDIGNSFPEIAFGNVIAKKVPIILKIDGDNIIEVNKTEEPGGPFRISARFKDRNGNDILYIKDNEFRTNSRNWDVVVSGQFITIHSAPRDIDLVIKTDPPDRLIFERFKMSHKGNIVDGRNGQPTIIRLINGQSLHTNHMTLDGCQIGILVDNGSLAIGVGGGSTYVGEMVINPIEDHRPNPRRKTATIIPFPRHRP